jgi:hypothetical protein
MRPGGLVNRDDNNTVFTVFNEKFLQAHPEVLALIFSEPDWPKKIPCPRCAADLLRGHRCEVGRP